ncbi:permease [Paenarthrobacter sp. Z7-10]|uniref:permease n=1 Tax=Paenarthrobacter sp. Z7-10 TaxID=2787635 RepID=UPI0022A91A08|nr:permease [Paenarthrobacter sp. Z7-10]MCZ2404437.1 permease [Paenarthrobacter sp. Z7-10]
MTFLGIAGQSLTEAFFMFWGTLWALVFGFTLSGAVQAFVSRHEMQKAMGDHRPGTVVRTGLLGAASSSCSYAATALAKSLFQRGADFTTAMVFMIASTNLVVELGVVLWLLIGWQFALAEFVGGAIMIALFVLIAPRVFPAAELEQARERLNTRAARQGRPDESDEAERHGVSLWSRLRSKAGWADAAGYAVSDVSMLRRELLIGYLVAGILAVAVPASAYNIIFFAGHGFWTDLENVIVGPFVAFISFVCSIGNVPLAAALFKGGLSFGGTVAFVFADLIALPLVIIYGKFYGRRIATRIFLSFWVVMSTAGLAVDLLFRVLGIQAPARPVEIVPTTFEWNYTTWLNIISIALAVLVYWLYRNRERFGGMEQYAKDLVCGMQVERAHAPAVHTHAGTTYYFCSDRCHEKFINDPDKYINQPGAEPMTVAPAAPVQDANQDEERGNSKDRGKQNGVAVDPVCGMNVETAHSAATHDHAGITYYFCSQGCHDTFAGNPAAFTNTAAGRSGAGT